MSSLRIPNRRHVLVFLTLTSLVVLVPAIARASDRPLAPELRGLGTLHMEVTTVNPKAQAFFDQGLRLLYAFNHQEARRAFQEAARLDPDLAMAYWGQAMALAPNLNAPLTDENATLAHQAVAAASGALDEAGPRERALVEALATRFASDPTAPRVPLDHAYAAAMARVAAAHPRDPDVQTLYADAVMNTMPWDYWQKDGSPKAETATLMSVLEDVIANHRDHAGAHHYYIHLLEASEMPERAEASADRLGSLMPAAGHVVHMPSHIYIPVGRYADAADINRRAIAADEDYLAQCQRQGLPSAITRTTSTFCGRRQRSRDAARWPSMPLAGWPPRCRIITPGRSHGPPTSRSRRGSPTYGLADGRRC
ncbi:MAG: hypothetical protein GEV06_20400 [Luteitalea sp.]|nr:hypothetical protein [Luteitalea sp.]